jgi:alkylation response protein AidB-like acyl-CoA dehydrogenase
MTTIDLEKIAADLGSKFAEGGALRDEKAEFVSGHYSLLKENKVFSAMIPEAYGGGGASHSQVARFLREIAKTSPSTGLSLSMHQHLTAAAIFNDKNGKPGRKLLDRVAADETILVSTGANDWLESNGDVKRAAGGFRVSARKPFASGSPGGDVLVTSAPYEDPDEGWQVLHFPVPLSADGVSLADDWDTMGMRATGSQTVILDDVFVPDAAIPLKRPRSGYHPAFNVILTVAMPLIMSVYLGVAEAAVARATQRAKQRTGDEVAPYLLGELTNRLTTAQLAVADMVAIANDLDFDPVLDTANAIVVRKTIAANAVIATTEKALETAGGPGYFRGFGLEQLVRDAHAAQFHPMQEKRQHRFTGRIALGLDPVQDAPAKPLQSAA